MKRSVALNTLHRVIYKHLRNWGSLMQQQSSSFIQTLKHWRKLRKFSQLELAYEAEISQKHISWLETGKSQPSREMVVKLSNALKVPIRERNHLLKTAGFAGIYTQNPLSAEVMQPVNQVLQTILEHHQLYPTFVLDRLWNIKMQNTAADALFQIAGGAEMLWQAVGDKGDRNIALLTVHPNGIRNYIKNWDAIKGPFLLRLKSEAFESDDQDVINFYHELAQHVDLESAQILDNMLMPVLPLEIVLGEISLSMFSVISTFGTAQDITANELRIETLYPSDESTMKFFQNN